MIIAIGSDHAGYDLKTRVVQWLKENAYEPMDLGTNSTDSVDYPDFAGAVAHKVSQGGADLGVVICKTGLGSCMAANKVPAVRAAHPSTLEEAELTRAHNDANVICLGAGTVDAHFNMELLERFLRTPFSGEERHRRRIEKLSEMEQEC